MTFVGRWIPSSRFAHIVEELPSGTLRTISRITGSLTVLGHCPMSDDRFDAAVDAMLSSNEIGEADDWPGCYSLILITAAGVTLATDPVGQFRCSWRRTERAYGSGH